MRQSRADDLEHELNRSALWAVTYGDLMSYLMIFFLVLFSFSLSKTRPAGETRKYEESLINIQKVFGGKEDPKTRERAMRREREEFAAEHISEDIQQKNLSKLVEVKTTEEKVRLILKEPVLFDSGKAELKSGASDVLRDIAREIRALPNAVVVEGHTDNVRIKSGPYKTNWELSMARAHAVIQVFESEGIDPKRLSGSGYGEHQPVADNTTGEGRSKNRRIEIELTRTK